MIEIEFLPQPYMNARLGKPHIITACICTEFSQALLIPYESFVRLLKSSHVHTTHIGTTPTLGVGAKTCHPSIQKCFTPTLGENTKNILYRLPQNKCSKFLLLSLKYFHCNREAWAMKKLFKKRKY
jgi:hypothetical protein